MIRGKRIVLTGLTGRLGGAIADALVADNELFGLARYSAPDSEAYWKSRGVHTVRCDYAGGDFAGAPEAADYVLHAGVWTGEGSPGGEAGHAMVQNAEGTGLLMARYRDVAGFLAYSTMGVYHPDPPARGYREDDDLGPGPASINYTASKLAAEGVVRTLCRIHGVPTTIARLTCQYGEHGSGGIPKMFALDPLVSGQPIIVAPDGEKLRSPIHNDDVIAFIEPMLAAASVPATIVNCGGDEPVSVEAMAREFARLTGLAPQFAVRDPYPYPYGHLDPTKRIAITGPCRVRWTEGMRRLLLHSYPHLLVGDPAPD